MESLTSPNTSSLRAWLPVCSLGFAAFIYVTSELMPIGLLPEMAISFEKTESFTGLLITFYAWAVALASLPLTMLSGGLDRKKLLTILFSVFIVANIVSSVATSFGFLLIARIFIAMAHAVFWSITTPLAARLAPEGKQARALTIVITGASLATVLGVPIGSIMGHNLGWRAAFGAIGAMAFVILIILTVTLPKLPSQGKNDISSLTTLFKNRTLMLIYVMTFLFITGNFTTFSYLAPYFQKIAGFTNERSSFLLLLMGLSGIVGSIIATKYVETKPQLGGMGSMIVIFVCLSLFYVCASAFPSLLTVCLLWGMSMASLCLVFQTAVLRLAKDSADIATSIYSGTFNIGIGAGALVGGQVYSFFGLENVGYAGALFFVLSFLLLLTVRLPAKEE